MQNVLVLVLLLIMPLVCSVDDRDTTGISFTINNKEHYDLPI